MQRLPIEILHNTFVQLPLKDRLECILVCSQWFHILDTRSLLYDVDISDRRVFREFMDMIERIPFRALQVEKLKLEHCVPYKFDNRKFYNIFPNLRYIELGFKTYKLGDEQDEDDMVIESTIDFWKKRFIFTNSKSKIERLAEVVECELTRQLCASNLCDKLRCLDINFGTRRNSAIEVLPHIKNMPVLKELRIECKYFGVEECEILHHNLPSVKDLNISFEDMPRIDSLPINITPAGYLDRLEMGFENPGDLTNQIKWYQYLTKKYINVGYFEFFDGKLYDRKDNDLKLLFEGGYLLLLKQIAYRENYFEVSHVPPEIDVFKALDEYDCQVEDMRFLYVDDFPFFECLAQSNQLKYIQELQIESYIYPSCVFQDMIALTKLSINTNFSRTLFNLTDYINVFPATVKEFTLSTSSVTAEPSRTRPSSIRYLRIECYSLTREIVDTVSTSFPELLDINLSGYPDKDLSITLLHKHLKEIHLRMSFEKHCPGYVVKSINQASPQYYLVSKSTLKNEPSLHMTAEPVTYEDVIGHPIVNLTYSSVDKLDLSTSSYYLYSKARDKLFRQKYNYKR